MIKLNIRTKFIGILVVASLVPLVVALATFLWFGQHSIRSAEGTRYQQEAAAFSHALTQSLYSQIELFDQWLKLSQLASTAAALSANQPELGPSERLAAINAIEAGWQDLPAEAPLLQQVLQNDLADQLRTFIGRNSNFAEIFVTDRHGRLIAASQKTSDYWQADEDWWQQAIQLKAAMVHLAGLNYDKSAQVYSIDLSLPLYHSDVNGSTKVGVIKAVLNASPIFRAFSMDSGDATTSQEVVLQSGEVLVNIQDPLLHPLTKKIHPRAAARLSGPSSGWALELVDKPEPSVMGFAPIRLAQADTSIRIYGLRPMWALVYRDNVLVMGPVNRGALQIGLLGIVLVCAFAWLGYVIASSKIIVPITRLRKATQNVVDCVRLKEGTDPALLPKRTMTSAALLEPVRAIRTGDEIDELAREFAFMAERTLNYQQRLETDIANKTAAIRRDLEFAREFQLKLMPQQYLRMESSRAKGTMGLSFHHIYQPASSVSGDFFDVLKLSDSKVGVFISDVMGHGIRSALVTAILTTLMQDIKINAEQPAQFLEQLNAHFYHIMRNSGELIFATAFYLVLDLKNNTAHFASAGHPSPLLVDRAAGEVRALTPKLSDNPALGLYADTHYQTFRRSLNPHDIFLMFTDGVFECSDTAGHEFGQERLRELVSAHQSEDVESLIAHVIQTIRQHSEPHGLDDDICLVGVEIVNHIWPKHNGPVERPTQ